MSKTPPDTNRRSFNLTAWRPSRRAVWWVLAAFAVGLGLFALIWLGDRNDDFYRVGETPPTASAPGYEPLPMPLPAGADDTSGLDPTREAAQSEPAPADGDLPQLVETAPPPAPPAPPAPAEAPPPAGALVQPRPIAGRMPAPRYPTRALRRGDSGTVMVRAEIGPDGVPTSVEVADGSGSRLLDRAAMEAVEQWRFHPAMRDGRPTTGTVEVPIAFESTR